MTLTAEREQEIRARVYWSPVGERDRNDLLAEIDRLRKERDAIASEADCADEENRNWEEQAKIDRAALTAAKAENERLERENGHAIAMLETAGKMLRERQEIIAAFEARNALGGDNG